MSQIHVGDTSRPHAGLAQPSSVSTMERDLPFEEQCCPASWELWQAGPGRIVNSLPPTQRASHGQTPKAPAEESMWNKKETTAHGPWGLQPHRREEPADAAAIEGQIWSLFPASQPWAGHSLAVCVGSASGIRAGRGGSSRRNAAQRKKSLFQTSPGSLASSGTKGWMQRGSRSDLTRTTSSTGRCVTSQPSPY